MLALCGLGVATRGALTQVMPRRFTVAQQRQIQSWEIGRRWRKLPETAIFPGFVSYQLPSQALEGGDGLALSAQRLGIGPPVGCTGGTDPAAAKVLDRYGCTTILRATYVDSTGSMLVTVGVAVLPSIPAATAAGNRLAHAEAAGHDRLGSARAGGRDARRPVRPGPAAAVLGHPRGLVRDHGDGRLRRRHGRRRTSPPTRTSCPR